MSGLLPKTEKTTGVFDIHTKQNRRFRQKARSIAPIFGIEISIFALFSLIFEGDFHDFHSRFCQKAIIWRGETDDFSGQK